MSTLHPPPPYSPTTPMSPSFLGRKRSSASSRRLSMGRGGNAPLLNRSFSFAKQQSQFRRPICPFISSTFQDFQAERDILVRKVFPALDAICKQRGTYCLPVDLRWGINSTQVSSGLVVQLCLDYVKRCAPYFICLLGERYGCCRPKDATKLPKSHDQLPEDADWLDKNLMVAGNSGYEWVLQQAYQDKSVTEIEIIQAAFLEDGDFCRFYFRQQDHTENLFKDLPEDERLQKLQIYESESEYHALKSQELKTRIVKKGLQVEYFKTPEELGMLVFKNWKAIVNKLYPPLMDVITSADKDRFLEWTAHETYAETRRTVFIKSPELDDLFDHMTDFALTCITDGKHKKQNDDDDHLAPEPDYSVASLMRKKKPLPVHYQSILVLAGDRGCGKTSAVANWVTEFVEECADVTTFIHYVGSSAASMDAAKLMRRAIGELRPEYTMHADPDELEPGAAEGMATFRNITEAFVAALGQQPCVVLLDGLDEMSGACHLPAKQIKELEWLPFPLPPQCKIIVTTLKSDTTYRRLAQRGDVKVLTIPPLKDPDHKKTIIKEHLAVHCKCLNREQLERVVTCRLSEKPIFLSILANELRVFGIWGDLDKLLEGYLEAMSIRDLWGRIIQRWVREYGWSLETDSQESNNGEASRELTGWVADSLRLIAVSRHGLSTAEILAILPRLGYHGKQEVTPIDWAVFRCAALDSLFERPGGLLTFFHKHFKEAVEHTLLGVVTPEGQSAMVNESPMPNARPALDKRTFHKHLADYFYELPTSSRRTGELPWQLERAEDYERLCEVLNDPVIFLKLFGEKLTLSPQKVDLLHYWQTLCENDFDPSATYCKTLEKVLGEIIDSETQEVEQTTNGAADEKLLAPLTSAEEENKAPHEDYCRIPSESVISEYGLKDPDSDSVLILGNHIGFFLCALGHFRMGEKILLKIHERLQKGAPMMEQRRKLCCQLQESLGNMCFYLMRCPEAETWYHRALRGVASLLDNVTESTDDRYMLTEMKARLLDHLGTMKVYDGAFLEAEKMLNRARKCMDFVGSLTGIAQIQYHIGILRSQQEDFPRALDQFKKALTTYETWFGKAHPRVADALEGLAGVMANRNYRGYNKKEAERLYRRSLMIRESLLGHKHLLVATTLCHLGHLLSTESKAILKEEAVKMLQRARDIRTSKLGPDHHLTVELTTQLGNLEAAVSYRPHRPPDRRTAELPASSMSWHDKQLGVVQKKAVAANAAATHRALARVTLSRPRTPTRSINGSQRKISIIVVKKSSGAGREEDEEDDEYEGDEAEAEADAEAEEYIQTSKEILLGDTAGYGAISEASSSQCSIDERSEVLNQRLSGFLDDPDDLVVSPPQGSGHPVTKVDFFQAPKERKKVVVTNKRQPPVPMLQRFYRASSAPVTPIRSNGYINSGRSSYRPHSSMTVHRSRCETPGAFAPIGTITRGPHCELDSLLVHGEAYRGQHQGRPGPGSRSPLHTSAWYQIPGRYSTSQKPFPPKRTQRRLSPSMPPTANMASSTGSSQRSSRTASPRQFMQWTLGGEDGEQQQRQQQQQQQQKEYGYGYDMPGILY